MSIICDQLEIDVWELIALANRHPRVTILQPGAGVGGHCIAVDPWFIVDTTPDEARIIRTAREVNDAKPHWVLDRVKVAMAEVLAANPGQTMAEVRVACLGLAFKPDIDDLRESPAVEITEQVARLGCRVLAVEPHIEQLPARLEAEALALVGLDEALAAADVVCVLVKHQAFQGAVDGLRQRAGVIDTVGLLRRAECGC